MIILLFYKQFLIKDDELYINVWEKWASVKIGLPSIASTREKLIKLDGGSPLRGGQLVKSTSSASDGSRTK